MLTRSSLAVWLLIFIGCLSLAVVSYGLAQSDGPLRTHSAYVLWPGVGLYTLLNGSLLFGGGFGALGNFLLVSLGSAVAWSLLIAVLFGAWVRVLRRLER